MSTLRFVPESVQYVTVPGLPPTSDRRLQNPEELQLAVATVVQERHGKFHNSIAKVAALAISTWDRL